ncbi:MAG: sulfurtransferase [Prochloraceae cyanobacterium]|nr:sulfurtransferase [Prochloraceae cyanobacterium]
MEIKTLISPEELMAIQKARDPLVIIDTRAPEDYGIEHIPGAINMREIFTYLLDSSSSEALEKLQEDFARLLGAAGLSGEETVVIYEDALNKGYGQSCRGYFLLEYLGYPKISILHGGYQAWKQANLPITSEVPTTTLKSFPLQVNSEIMVTKEQMLKSLDDPNIVKLDVRDYDEWIGESSSPYGKDFCPRKGRIPGAVWIEWYRMMKSDSEIPMFRSKEEILKVCEEVNLKPEQTVYVYCFKGSRAANTTIALREAGFKDVRNYYSSWNDWSRDPKMPIETGTPDPQKMAARA